MIMKDHILFDFPRWHVAFDTAFGCRLRAYDVIGNSGTVASDAILYVLVFGF